MADDIDKAQEAEEMERQHQIVSIRARSDLPPGQPGDCETCGEWSGRLVGGQCAPCRDKYQRQRHGR